MDFREINYVMAIAKYQNITKAAEALYISQPSLSKFLMTLENNLGLKLFRRVGHKYMLTYPGERYVDYAKKILDTKNDLDSELADIIKSDTGILNIAMPNMRCTYMLPKTLPVFAQSYPNVKVNIFEGTSAMIDKKLIDGEIELAFYSKPHEINSVIEYEKLAAEELLICARKNHPIGKFAVNNPASRYKKLEIGILKNERLILLSPEQRTGQISRYYLKQSGVKFDNVITTSNMPAIIDLTENGYGISFIFDSHLRYRTPEPVIDAFSFGEPRVTSDFVAAYRKGSYLPAYAREFITTARNLYD